MCLLGHNSNHALASGVISGVWLRTPRRFPIYVLLAILQRAQLVSWVMQLFFPYEVIIFLGCRVGDMISRVGWRKVESEYSISLSFFNLWFSLEDPLVAFSKLGSRVILHYLGGDSIKFGLFVDIHTKQAQGHHLQKI